MSSSTRQPSPPLIAIPTGSEKRILQGDARAPGHGAADARARSRLPIAVAFAIALVGMVMWIATSGGSGSVRQLPAGQRAALVQRSLQNLRELCRASDRPREFCREQANLLLSLPECDETCRTEARGELMADTAVK